MQVGLAGAGFQQHVVLGWPPAVDRLLAGPGTGGDPVDREPRVAGLGGELERGGQDRLTGFLAALAARPGRV